MTFAHLDLLAPQDGPLEWQENGRVLIWRGCGTVAFFAEIESVYRRMAFEARVLPPIGAVAMFFAALRRDFVTEHGPTLALRAAFERLPADARASQSAKERVAAQFFEGALPAVPPAALAQALRILDDPSLLRHAILSHATWSDSEAVVARALAAFDPAATPWRLRAGIDAPPEGAEFVWAACARVRELLGTLRDDAALGGTASLVREALAALRPTPRAPAPRHDGFGGASGIADRGPLDRLLTSELAHDDFTLAARVALGQALYLRRETPDEPAAPSRIVLVDCGVRLWGRPRVFAAAVALALCAEPRRGAAAAFFTQGGAPAPFDPSTREGLTALLAALDPTPEPGAALRALCDRPELAAPEREAFLITHAAVADDPDFGPALEIARRRRMRLVTVAADGSLAVALLSPEGARTWCSAQLTWRDERPADVPSFVGASRGAFEPAMFRVDPAPLLFTHDALRVVESPLGTLALGPRGWLTHWPSYMQGARVLSTEAFRGPVHLLRIDPAGVVHVVSGDRPELRWFRYDCETRASESSRVYGDHQGRLRGVVLRHGHLFVVGARDARVFRQTDGADVGILDGQGELRCGGGDFVKVDGRWCFPEPFPAPGRWVPAASEPPDEPRRRPFDALALRFRKKWEHPRFRAAGVTGAGDFALRNANGRAWRLGLESARDGQWLKLVPADEGGSDGVPRWTTFERTADAGPFLAAFAFGKDGAVAAVDHRGFLHLKSGDAEVAEVSLALSYDGASAVWTSDGLVHGPVSRVDTESAGMSAPASAVLERVRAAAAGFA